MIKENIKFNGLDVNLNLSLGDGKNLFGQQQEISSTVEKTKQALINPIIDGEIRRFTYEPYGNTTCLSFSFYLNGYNCSFLNAGFLPEELSRFNSSVQNSFFIMELYDTYDPYTQVKISTNYLTKILTTGLNGTPCYEVFVPRKTQFNDLFIPISFLDANGGMPEITMYLKFSFYNAKSGKVSLFYNSANESLLTPEKQYFTIKVNPLTQKWKFTITTPIAKEILPTNAYVERVNNTINNTENKKQNYPFGKMFDRDVGNYE